MMNPAICLVFLALEISLGDAEIGIDEVVERTFHPGLEARDVIDHQVRQDITTLYNKITKEGLENVFKSCQESLSDRNKLEAKLVTKGRVIKLTERKTDTSLIRNRMSDPVIQAREKLNLMFEEATAALFKRYNLSSDDIGNILPKFPLNGELSRAIRDSCTVGTELQGNCNSNSRYRTQDGQCNNLNNPDWGMAMVCQRRLLYASYVGNSGFRVADSGNPLPAPRTLSLNLHNHLNRPTNYVTHMYMFFGQLLDHDLTLTPFSTTDDNQAIQCCPPENETHSQCAPVLIGRNDPFYSQFGTTCLNFVRSVICTTCAMGHRIQMDQVTSFIDASFVYGNSLNETLGLRRNDGTGGMRVLTTNNGDLLPQSPNPQEDQCSFPQTNDICFEAGDPRANQHTALTSLHTIFLREHNRLSSELHRINPTWDDERIFQEARRIVGAEMQVITYKEYLPITLGNDRMSYFRLWVSDSGTTSYESQEDPTMMLEFTTAAFRFGHSLIHSVVANSPLNGTNERRLLRNEFFQPFDLYNGIIGPLMRGASNSPAQWFDRHLVHDVTNFLYRIRGDPAGLDLASFNINRGRDHGIPPYVDAVFFCSEGRIEVESFRDLVNYQLMKYEQAEALRRNYENVADVDLWPGILMEIPNEGAVVGPTAACIIGLQFNKLKFGDRFYFEHSYQAGCFTYRQLQQIRKITLSQIICLNSNANDLPSNAMLFSSRNNPVINCNNVKGINLSYWRE